MNYDKYFKIPILEQLYNKELDKIIDAKITKEDGDTLVKVYFIYKDENSKYKLDFEYFYPSKDKFAKQFIDDTDGDHLVKKIKEKKLDDLKDSASLTDINKVIRKFLKKNYPDYKFSVKKSGYSSIYVMLKNAPEIPFNRDYDNYDLYKYEINQYYLTEEDSFKPQFLEMFYNVIKFILLMHYDNSNPQIDYFNSNFYFSVGVEDFKIK